MSEFRQKVDAVSKSLKERSKAAAIARTKEREREHLSAYIEQLTASASVSRVRLFFGHINADMDSVGGTVGATEWYDAGVPVLNGEIMYACAYARSGDKTILDSTDVKAWSLHHQGRSIDVFGANASRLDTSLMYFEDAFDPDHSKVEMVDHNRVDRLMVLVHMPRV